MSWKSDRTEQMQDSEDATVLREDKRWKEAAFTDVGELIDDDQWQQAQERHVAELLRQIRNEEGTTKV